MGFRHERGNSLMCAVESPGRCSAMFLGTVEYARAWELQRDLHRRVADGKLPTIRPDRGVLISERDLEAMMEESRVVRQVAP